MTDKIINYDDAIITEINNKDFKLTINASSFSNEFYTVDYINSIFNSLKTCCNVCNTIVRETENYFNGIDEIGETPQPDLIDLKMIFVGEAIAVDNAIIESSNNVEESVASNGSSSLPNLSDNKTNTSNTESVIGGLTASGLPNLSNNTSGKSNNDKVISIKPSSNTIGENKIINAKIILNNNERLNVFFDSNNNSSPIESITSDTQIKVIGEDNNMYKIIYGNNLDKIGYVSKDYIDLISIDNQGSIIVDAKVVANSNELLRIYQTSNLEVSVNETLTSGSNVKVLGEENNMYKIIYGDNLDKIGYVSKNYIQ